MSRYDHGQLVVNWHLTEVCNYRCSYCYARWAKRNDARELIHDAQGTQSMLLQLFEFFRPDNQANPLKQEMHWGSVRLNLAGGEPLLYRQRTLDVVSIARDIGFYVSMITNGSHFDSNSLEQLAPNLSLIGISLDSGQEGVSRLIGRVDKNGRVLELEALADTVRAARRLNPHLRLKINTVVNALNCQEDMNAVIQELAPNKWKVLRMLPVITNSLAVSDDQFRGFVDRHHELADVMQIEDSDSFTESYIMIDPHGCFFQNSTGGDESGYQYSRPILQAGVFESFSDLTFSAKKYLSRYVKPSCIKQSRASDHGKKPLPQTFPRALTLEELRLEAVLD